jgi:hypothetical protein
MVMQTATPTPTSNSPPIPPCQLSVSKSGNNAVLTWTIMYRRGGPYVIYRGTTPYFTPTTPYAYSNIETYTDVGAIGDPSVNYYHQVSASNQFGTTYCINYGGEFDFALTAGLPGGAALDDIAIPLDISVSLVDAEGLANWIETQASPPVPFGTVKQLLKWDAPNQAFRAWSHEFGFGDNFATATGDYIFLVVDQNAPGVTSFVGRVPHGGTIHFSLSAGTPSQCALNFLSLPLDQPGITNADQLSDAIGTPSPPGPPSVIQALDWVSPLQTFAVWSNQFNFGDNFPTTIGYPYIVCLSDNAPPVWP